MTAAGETLAALLDPIPASSRKSGDFSRAIDTQLSRLAVAAVGKNNVAGDKRAAINSLLAPILSDRILNQAPSAESGELWKSALTQDQSNLDDLQAQSAGILNRMLHLAMPHAEKIRPQDWGAVVEFPTAWKGDAEMLRRVGAKLNEVLGGDLKISRPDRDACRVCAVRIGAVCDFAQSKNGPIPYLFGAEIPLRVNINRPPKLPMSEWKSPIFELNDEPFFLVLNCRYLFTLTANDVQGLPVRYRLREQILMQLISHAGDYVTRPGIVHIAYAEAEPEVKPKLERAGPPSSLVGTRRYQGA